MTDQIHSPRNIGNYSFRFICRINPERDQTGVVCAFLPQSSYKNFRRLKLHNCGSGPFCRFRIPSNLPLEGVYALLIGESVPYVGECIHLSKRFNMGYGQISPRNCFVGGQPTNCKINRHVLEAAECGKQLGLWFLETQNRKAVERELIGILNPPWNIQGRL